MSFFTPNFTRTFGQSLKICTLILTLTLSITAQALKIQSVDSLKLNLTISDYYDNPIKGAVIFLNNNAETEQVSDASGKVTYTLTEGSYTIESYAANFLDYQQTVNLEGSDMTYTVAHAEAIHWTTDVSDAPIGVSEKNGIRIATIGGKLYLWTAYGGEPGMNSYSGLTNFYQYDPQADSWSRLPDAPFSSAYGISTSHGQTPDGQDAIYVLKGYWSGTRTFLSRYNISSGIWENNLDHNIPWRYDLGGPNSGGDAFQDYPRNGAAMAYCPSEKYIYLFPGAGYTYANYDWYRYSVLEDKWEDMGELPHRQGPGNAAVWVDGNSIGANQNYIYIQFGTGPSGSYTHAEFWRYGISSETWEKMEKHPYGADDGSMLAWDGEDYIFHSPGAYREQKWDKGQDQKREFMRYTLSTDTWEEMEKTPYHRWGGWDDAGGMVLIGNYIYAMKGGDDVAWAEEGCDNVFSDASPCVSGGGDIPNNFLWRYTIHPDRFDLRVINAHGNGHINIKEGTNTYQKGATVELYATPEAGWEFKEWLVDDEFYCNQNPNFIVMNDDKSLQAVFTEIPASAENMNSAKPDYYLSNKALHLKTAQNNVSVEIFDLVGRRVFDIKANNPGSHSFNLSLPNGIYILRLRAEGLLSSEKIIIQQ